MFVADGVIRNLRSDGPADRTPYGMGGHNSVTGESQALPRAGRVENHDAVDLEGDWNIVLSKLHPPPPALPSDPEQWADEIGRAHV